MASADAALADTPHEVAAKQIFKVSHVADNPRMVRAYVAAMGVRASPIDREALVEALESSEVEAIYLRNHMKLFFEPDPD